MTTPSTVRVLHVVESTGAGVIRHLSDVVVHASGVEHHVASPPAPPGLRLARSGALHDSEAVSRMRAHGATVHEVAMRRSPMAPANARALLALRRLIREVRPSVVHGHSSVGGALSRLAALGTSIPVVYTAHAVARGGAYLATERALGHLTDRWIAVSPSEAYEAIRLRLAPREAVVVIPNGIGLAPPSPVANIRVRLGVPEGAPLVATAARLVAQKAPENFVAACGEIARRAPDAHFLLVGLGPLQREVDRAVAIAGIGDRWHQLEHVDDLAGALCQVDVFVLASRFEGGPYAPLEAMRAGVPVVLTDVVGNRDVVEDGVSGVLVPFGDAGAMASAVLRLVGDRSLRNALVAAGDRRLHDRFDVASMGAALSELYAELAAEGRRRRTRRLPRPIAVSSNQPPDSSAAQ